MGASARVLVGLVGLAIVFGPVDADAAGRSRARGSKTSVEAKASGEKARSKSKKPKRRAALDRARAKKKHVIRVEAEATSPRAPLLSLLDRPIVCPPDMVAVAGRVCVDRFELHLRDASNGAIWSPFYAPDADRSARAFDFYGRTPAATTLGASMPIPLFPGAPGKLVAESTRETMPQGYMNRADVARACEGGGKRLCSESEWVTACMGEDRTEFPYGTKYRQDTCNVFRETHPSFELHGTASRYHDDPRNGLVEAGGRTLLLPSGSLSACASRWGNDAIYDMVGNLDEWVDGGSGVFVGGFYSRGSRSGCYARISSHAAAYSDYSTGGRCCKDPDAAPPL